MTERDEMLALADRLEKFQHVLESARKCDNKTISVWSDDPLIIEQAADALRSAARTDAGYGAGFEACREAAKALVSDESADWHNTGYGRSVAKRIVDAIAALPAPGGGSLFQQCDFISAAGLPLTWKIECDRLSDADWRTIAMVGAKSLPPFREAVGVPRGGAKLAQALNEYATPEAGPVLIVDDVWTTGKSLTEFAVKHGVVPWIGFVAFARGPLPPNVSVFMQLIAPGGKEVTVEELAMIIGGHIDHGYERATDLQPKIFGIDEAARSLLSTFTITRKSQSEERS